MRETQPNFRPSRQRSPPPMKFSRLLLIAPSRCRRNHRPVRRPRHHRRLPASGTRLVDDLRHQNRTREGLGQVRALAARQRNRHPDQRSEAVRPGVRPGHPPCRKSQCVEPCTVRPGQSAYLAAFTASWSPDADVPKVYVCGDWDVTPTSDGWFGWTKNSPQEEQPQPCSSSPGRRTMMLRHLSGRCELVRRRDPVHRHATCYSLSPSASCPPAGARTAPVTSDRNAEAGESRASHAGTAGYRREPSPAPSITLRARKSLAVAGNPARARAAVRSASRSSRCSRRP